MSNIAPRRPVLLVIMDGVGVNPSRMHNAVSLADTPRLDELFAHHPHTVIEASGRACGLPDGQMGNSEVGHLTLGSGAINRQDLVRIDDAIKDGSFYENAAINQAMQKAADADRPIHLIGLVSDGGVHSHVRHLLALIKMAKKIGARPLIHMITDGRDTAPKSALGYLDQLEPKLKDAKGAIATISGRYYAMDRDQRWERTEEAFNAIVRGDGPRFKDAREALAASYEAEQHDEFIRPAVLDGFEPLSADDAMIFFNFRNDRPRQLTEALGQAEFTGFDRGDYQPIVVTCLTEYDPRFLSPIGFPPERPKNVLAEAISQAGIKQFHCAETEKYAHVTFFFNGGKEETFAGEDRVMVPSPKVATYDLQPEMSAREVADAAIDAVRAEQYGFVLVNFANGDMVGHTAVREAVIKAMETVDHEVGRLVDAASEQGYSIILTADHGNCDEMVDPVTGDPHTQHTTYPVPCIVIDKTPVRLRTGGGIANIAATVLELMGLPLPKKMKRSLLLDKPSS
ncbi:2,3-bisphosphoglycerate-independent phosphoglycerate mutase [Guyparkeria sp. SB14A]|uniref:2,3-bisphosphoglycerate-independent phosphoglycerate mutase n=1 Tax=Guyparkeria sp. SB14A TaxID=2571147 RepID=UPI0010ACABD6|nr:2,3-bisphosphoglycerate-independent phosphoglycerate mutase [Guyparkeria sp. SB14A]TKA89981.1 2,3-bisphosphoglycerate-independent phosphoglycerate mutase [Guyparkeria sp. SB14A]